LTVGSWVPLTSIDPLETNDTSPAPSIASIRAAFSVIDGILFKSDDSCPVSASPEKLARVRRRAATRRKLLRDVEVAREEPASSAEEQEAEGELHRRTVCIRSRADISERHAVSTW
jgi:hypothetical protein